MDSAGIKSGGSDLQVCLPVEDMTYRWSITTEKPTLSLSGSQIFLDTENIEEQCCPAVITEFLNKMQWVVATSHPDTGEPLFTKQDMGRRPLINKDTDVNLTEGMYFHWYEAVAYEHAKMMSIGLGE